MDDERWWHKSRCEGTDTEMFYPPRDKTKYKKIAAQAKTYCLGANGKNPCPVRQECLWDAIENNEEHGIWGGMSHRERNALVRKWQRQYKGTMTLKEYVFQLDKKRATNGNSTKERPVEVLRHKE
jgi:WhiB family redox-sensing transcriptional regulator